MDDTVLIAHDLMVRLIRDDKMPPHGHQLVFFALSLEESPQKPVPLSLEECSRSLDIPWRALEEAFSYLLRAGYLEAVGSGCEGVELYRIANFNEGDEQ